MKWEGDERKELLPATYFLALRNPILTLWVAGMETYSQQFSPITAILVPLVNAPYAAGPWHGNIS